MTLASLEAALPANDSILLDTTVVIAYFTGTEVTSPIATHIIEQFVRTGRNPAVVSAVTALEVLVDPVKRADDELYRSAVFFLTHTDHLDVVPIGFEEARQAAVLRGAHGFKAPDALIIAGAYWGTIAHVVCNDEEWKRRLSGSGGPAVCYLQDHLPFP